MSEHDEKAEERVEDLDVPEDEREDVKGGALNAYIPHAQGEKQGKFQGGVQSPGVITGAGPGGGPH
jgi:hypothetical protein